MLSSRAKPPSQCPQCGVLRAPCSETNPCVFSSIVGVEILCSSSGNVIQIVHQGGYEEHYRNVTLNFYVVDPPNPG